MAVTTADAEEQRFVEALSEARPHVLAAFGRLGAAPHDLEDLVQEVFARAWRYRSSFDQKRPVAPWLSGIATRVWTDHRRRGGRPPESLGNAEPRAPDLAAKDVEIREQIVLALERLTPIQREVLLAFHRDGESLEAIGTSGPPALVPPQPSLHSVGDPGAGSTSKAPLRAESGRLKPAVRAAAAAIAILAVAALTCWVWTKPGASPPAPPVLRARDVVKPFPPDASPVVSWSVRVERRTGAITTSDSLGSDGLRTSDTSTLQSHPESARIVVHRFTRHP